MPPFGVLTSVLGYTCICDFGVLRVVIWIWLYGSLVAY